MSLLTNENVLGLWQDTIKHAENRCSISLKQELETYLVKLLVHYTPKPELAKQVLATAFLEAKLRQENDPATLGHYLTMQQVGDQCLLMAGLFPQLAEKKLVKISYFVNLGRSAYTSISDRTNDLFGLLSFQFVALMDVLQSIRSYPELLPLEAYEQWQEVGSERALKILQSYTKNSHL
jgi:hypothetical protein